MISLQRMMSPEYMKSVREELSKMLWEKAMSYTKASKDIGITCHTLVNFIEGKRETSRFTLVKIVQWLKKNDITI